MSGIRESNPPPRLGKPVHYRCANSANGADTRTRTGDLRITNALLYQLSHIGGIALQSYIKKNKQPNFCFMFLFLLLLQCIYNLVIRKVNYNVSFINKDFTLTELVLYNLLFYVLCVLRSELWYLVLSFSLLLITLYSIFNAL